jgi:hypothetical protein
MGKVYLGGSINVTHSSLKYNGTGTEKTLENRKFVVYREYPTTTK